MNSLPISQTTSTARSSAVMRGLGMAALAAAAWGLSATANQAHARDDVQWSIGINSPGVSVGVTNAAPVIYGYPVYDPRPVVVYPRPVVVAPQPIYYGAPVYRWDDRRYERKWHKRHHHRHDRRGGWDD